MNARIRYAEPEIAPERHAALIRVFRVMILLGVWILVGFAGVAVWLRLTG